MSTWLFHENAFELAEYRFNCIETHKIHWNFVKVKTNFFFFLFKKSMLLRKVNKQMFLIGGHAVSILRIISFVM